VLVTEEGRRVLTDKVPKQIEEIETLMARGAKESEGRANSESL
jgi:hypothetical protein